MQFLIATGEAFDERISVVKIVDATMPEIELEVIEEIDKPEPIEEVVQEQPEIQERQTNLDSGPALNIQRASVELDTGLQLSNASIAATDGDYLPLVAIAPQYPTRAAQRGIQGWCLVSFTVDGLGNVVEESIQVVDAEPTNIFDRSSLRAAARFKFQPRVVDGEGVNVDGVQYLFRYQLEDN
jgi:protein TonB